MVDRVISMGESLRRAGEFLMLLWSSLKSRTFGLHFIGQMTSYRLDRIFWSMPLWSSHFLDVSGGTLGYPDQLHRDGISDHAPVTLSAREIAQHSVEDRPIPSWVTHSPQFKSENKKRIEGHTWISKIDQASDCAFAAYDFDN